MRTQKDEVATKHLTNSKEIFLKLLAISRKIDGNFIAKCQQERDYEELDLYIMKSLLGQ
jgi:xylose isomerase